MKIGNITLIIGETYYTKFEKVEKLKLDKIHQERISENGNEIQVTVRSFPKKANETSYDSWVLWSNEIFYTREEAKKQKN
jgi:hypothetical protein